MIETNNSLNGTRARKHSRHTRCLNLRTAPRCVHAYRFESPTTNAHKRSCTDLAPLHTAHPLQIRRPSESTIGAPPRRRYQMRDSSDALAAALDVAAADDQRRTDQRHRLRTSPPPARAPLGAEDEAATLEEASVAEAARPPAVVLADGLGADEPGPGTRDGASGGGSAVAPPHSEEAVPAMACRGADKLSRPVVTAALVEEDAASTGPVPPPTSLLAPPTASCGCSPGRWTFAPRRASATCPRGS